MSRVSTVRHTRSRGTVHGRLWRVLRAPLPVMSTRDEAGVSERVAVLYLLSGLKDIAALPAILPRASHDHLALWAQSIDDVVLPWQRRVWAVPGRRAPRVGGWCGRTSRTTWPITPVVGRQPEPCGVLSFASGQRPAPLPQRLRHYGRALRGRASLFASF